MRTYRKILIAVTVLAILLLTVMSLANGIDTWVNTPGSIDSALKILPIQLATLFYLVAVLIFAVKARA